MKKYHKVLKFLISGGLAAATEYGSFLLFTLALPVVAANALSFTMGLIVSFSLNRSWVFGSKGDTKKKFTQYLLLALINLMLGSLIIFVLVGLGISAFVAKIIIMLLIASWNYLIFSKMIFKD
jgi:putative flippase GtrA